MLLPVDPGPTRLDGLAGALIDGEAEVRRAGLRSAGRPPAMLSRVADATAVLALLLSWTSGATGSRDAFALATGGAALAVLVIGLRQVALALMLALPGRRSRVIAALSCLLGFATVAYCAVQLTTAPEPRPIIVNGNAINDITETATSFAVGGPALFVGAFTVGSFAMLIAGARIAVAVPADLLAGRIAIDQQILTATIRTRHLEALRPARPDSALAAVGIGGLLAAAAGLREPWLRPVIPLGSDLYGFQPPGSGADASPHTTTLMWAIGIGAAVCLLVAGTRALRVLVAPALAGTGLGCTVLAWVASRPGHGLSLGLVRGSGAWLAIAGSLITLGCGVALDVLRRRRSASVLAASVLITVEQDA